MLGSFESGLVETVDTARAQVRVRFPGRDNLVSFWMPVLQQRTMGDQYYWLPERGEQVYCLVDAEGVRGVVLGAIYSDADLPPTDDADVRMVKFSDGTTVEYNRSAHRLEIQVVGGAGAEIRVSSAGDVRVEAAGALHLVAGSTMDLEATGALTVRGNPVHWNP